jgi:hypothetical protein
MRYRFVAGYRSVHAAARRPHDDADGEATGAGELDTGPGMTGTPGGAHHWPRPAECAIGSGQSQTKGQDSGIRL